MEANVEVTRQLTCFGCEGAAVCVDILADIILFGKVKQFPDLRCPFWTSHSWLLSISQPRKLIVTLLNNYQVEYGEIRTDNASSNRLPSPLTISPSIPTETRGTCS